MEMWLETISTKNDGTSTAQLQKYPDEITAAIFFHSSLNTNLRLVSSGELKAYYANVHNASGVVVRSERWANEEEPTED